MKKHFLTALFILSIVCHSFAQNVNGSIRNGNKLYKQNDFGPSVTEYKKALSQSPENAIANYNLGNAHYRNKVVDESLKSYEATIGNTDKKQVKQKAYYNQGVAWSSQQKLQESIEAWKNALKLDASDKEARENLQKALSQQKKQQKEKEEKKEDKEKKKDKKQDKDQPNNPEQKSRLNKKQVEQLLKALAQKEKEVQQKMQAKNASPNRQEKDW